VYHSTRGLTNSDIEPVQKSLRKVEVALKDDGSANGILNKLKEYQERLRADVEIISKQQNPSDQLRQNAMNDLNSVALSLAVLNEQFTTNRDENYTAVSESLTKLEALRKQIEPMASPERVIGMAITQAGKLAVELAWPLAAIFVFLYLFTSRKAPDRMAELFSNFKSVELFSAKFELGEKIRASAEETFAKFRKQGKELSDLWAQRKSLEEKITEFLSDKDNGLVARIDAARALLSPPMGPLTEYRCTIHVPDLLFAETFYQLIDYIPRQRGAETRGRTWSYRFGFIGRIWRSGESGILGSVTTDINELIYEWGMTKEEAESAGKDRQSFFGVLLKQNNVQVGLFYVDAREQNAFGLDVDKSLRKFVEDELKRLEITKDLAAINEELRGRAPLIRIYSQR